MEPEIDVSDGMKKTSPSKRTERRNFSSYPGKNKKSLSLLPSAVGIISNNDGQHIEREKKKEKGSRTWPRHIPVGAIIITRTHRRSLLRRPTSNIIIKKIIADATKLDQVYISIEPIMCCLVLYS
jgi:hypothetical protein